MSSLPTLNYDPIEIAGRPGPDHELLDLDLAEKAGIDNDLKQVNVSPLLHLAGLSIDQLHAALDSSPAGLTSAAATTRHAITGPNVLPSARGPSRLSIAVAALISPFNVLLAILAGISAGTDSVANAVIMGVMIVASTSLRFWQELKSTVEARRLVDMVTDEVDVWRDGTCQRADRKAVVVGDLVRVRAGDVFPGDGIIVDAHSMQISQSALTGEMLPVEKAAGVDTTRDLLVNTRIALSGTAVVAGSGCILVSATGSRTYIAGISALLTARRQANAFEIGMRNVSYLLIAFMLVMSPIVLIIQGATTHDWRQAALFAVSVAVGLTPEMLPLVIVGNLAIGARQLARKRVIVKRLDGVQTMGAMTILCSDKTGTLTQDALECQGAVDAHGMPSSHALRLATINATLQTGSRSPLDEALAGSGGGDDVDVRYIKLGEIPFDSTRRMLSVHYEDEQGRPHVVTKGAVDEVIARCELADEDRTRLRSLASSLGQRGLRLLAVASKPSSTLSEDDLQFAGFCTFLDPPKPDARASIARLTAQNVAVKILTGDAPEISQRVALEIGLEGDVVTGSQLSTMSPDARLEAISRGSIFAKLSPTDKLDIVATLRAQGHVVGFLGDGVNDALALRSADVGIAVDSGTSIAKDAAGIILLEKSLDCICDGVHLGRITLVQSLKYIKMAASSNFGNVFSVLIASFWLPYDPMTPLQILLQNLLYDLSQTSIPWDNVDPQMLTHARRWNSRSIFRFMVCLGPTSSVFDVCTFALNTYFYRIRSGVDSPLSSLQVARAQTAWFMEGFLTQVFVVYALRTPLLPFFQSRPSPVVVATTVGMAVIALALPYLPFAATSLAMQAPEPSFWGFLAAMIVGYYALIHAAKQVYLKVFKGDWI